MPQVVCVYLPDAPHVKALLEILADEVCWQILLLLAERPMDAETLSERAGDAGADVARNLQRLVDVQVLATEEVGDKAHYRLGRGVSVQRHGEHAIVNVVTSGGSEISVRMEHSATTPVRQAGRETGNI